MGKWKYYRCGMISLIFIPVLFYFELKTNSQYATQYGIKHRYLLEPDSSRWVGYEPLDYFVDYSSVKKRDTISVSQAVDMGKINPLFNFKSGNSLCFSFTDNATYGDYISIYNGALKHQLSVYFTDSSSLLVFNPKDHTTRIAIDRMRILEWPNLEGDLLPEQTLWIAVKEMVEHYYICFTNYVDLLIQIDLFYQVIAICMGYLLIVVLNMRQLKWSK